MEIKAWFRMNEWQKLFSITFGLENDNNNIFIYILYNIKYNYIYIIII